MARFASHFGLGGNTGSNKNSQVPEMTKVTSLPADDKSCGWYHLSPSRKPRPAHVGNRSARWVVLGAGYVALCGVATLTRRLKQELDPAGLFNPGRLYLEL